MTSTHPPHVAPADPQTIELSYTHRHSILDDASDPQFWYVSADAHTGDAELVVHVGDLELVRVDPYREDTFAVLDGYDADLALIAETALDPRNCRVHPDLEARLEPHGSDLLILGQAQLAPAWRGRGIGVLMAGLAVKHLSGGCQAALCYPAPLDRPEDEDAATWHGAVESLSSVWSQLGFEHFRNGVHVLDLALVTLDEAIDRLQRQQSPRA